MRHAAWLNTAPRDKAGKSKASRLKKIHDAGDTPSYPPKPLCDYLVGYLFDAGPYMSGAMGNVPLSHGEIRHWQDNIGIELSAWEVRTLRRLSGDYLGSSQAAESPDCKPPYTGAGDAQRLQQVELQQKLDLFLS